MPALVITRAANHSPSLADQMIAQGWQALTIPLVDAHATNSPLPAGPFDLCLAISPNAIKFAVANQSDALRTLQSLPLVAVGNTTAQHARAAGWQQTASPTNASSEALLELSLLQQVTDKRILLLCGRGGRQLIETTLQARGATVTRWEVYQRQPVILTGAQREQIEQLSSPKWVLVSSVSALSALKELKSMPLIVTSQRISDQANAQGFTVDWQLGVVEDEKIVNELAKRIPVKDQK
ncbi:MAG: uroporphyrinogen-III synthase [Gammaproteobacteria bacterium]|nr:uroporphyrinogen-III synthase [Gammaproteobacteria bacterium]